MAHKEAHKIAKKRQEKLANPAIMKNQFFGMLVLAVGIGALIVMVRYFFISLQVPTDIYQISTQELIPGARD